MENHRQEDQNIEIPRQNVLILGAEGMAGSMVYIYFKSLNKYNVSGLTRNPTIPGIITLDIEKHVGLEYLEEHIHEFDVVINCIGMLVKASEDNPKRAKKVNTDFPHWLAENTQNSKTKIIHLSTDCVFNGSGGPYHDTDIPDGTGVYATTKIAGEIVNTKDLTVRMSIIGPELKKEGTGLFSWFMRQKGRVGGYCYAYWNGITTLLLAQNLDKMIESNLIGLYQLAPYYHISKYNLLQTIQKVWDKKDVSIFSDNYLLQNKTLMPSRRSEYNPVMPNSYIEMLEELKNWGRYLLYAGLRCV